MFTGIVAAIGEVQEVTRGRLVVSSRLPADRLEVGGSVAVNGCCLTIVGLGPGYFAADVVPETLARTNLGHLPVHAPVNLELPCTPDTALDGHMVQGHVDATTRLIELRSVEVGKELRAELPPSLARYVAEKGSIAMDGTSLTVKAVDDSAFEVALIPHTLAVTIAGSYAVGHLVNLEVDLLARYTERLLATRAR